MSETGADLTTIWFQNNHTFLKEFEMMNSSIRSNTQRNRPPTSLAFGMVKGIILVVMLLIAITGGAQAAGSEPAPVTGGLPNCGDNPACGYIQMHANDRLVAWVMPECGDLPICGYIRMHSPSDDSTLAQFLSTQTPPLASDPQLVVSRTALVRSDPSSSAYSYGELPADFVSPVVGVSADASWWAIYLPRSVSVDGLGWVSASFVSVSNSDFRADEISCGESMSCGYIQMHNQAYLHNNPVEQMNCAASTSCDIVRSVSQPTFSVLEPSYAVERVMAQPLIAMTGE
jgi:hypothetical protein